MLSMEANNVDQEKTAHKGEVLSRYTLFDQEASKTFSRSMTKAEWFLVVIDALRVNAPLLSSLCILETPKRELWQTVKTQMKCSIMLHFIRVCTVC